jgi:hypothetical protein
VYLFTSILLINLFIKYIFSRNFRINNLSAFLCMYMRGSFAVLLSCGFSPKHERSLPTGANPTIFEFTATTPAL